MSLMSEKIRLSTLGKDRGFTLIEVMISLTILAFGMLGMTAMQTESLKYNHSAFLDSQAQFLLEDIAERIRANRGNNTYGIDYSETPATVAVDCEANACSSSQMALYDLTKWRAKVQSTDYLPAGESQILFDNLTRTFTISIRYNESHLGAADPNSGLRTVTITTRI